MARHHIPIRNWGTGLKCLAVIAALVATGPKTSHAQEPAETQPAISTENIESLSLEDLLNQQGTVTASKQLQRVADAPSNVIVVTRDQIQARGYMNLKDLLADLPGMETIENSFAEFGTMVPVRGVEGNNKILLLVNGMLVNPPGRENLMIRNDQSVRFAKRVEVVYGPGSTLYGTDAVSAVINIITDETPGASALASYGMFNTKEAAASYNRSINNGSFSSLVQYFDSDTMDISQEYADYYKPWKDAYDSLNKKPGEELFHRGNKGLNAAGRLTSGNTNMQLWYRRSERSSSDAFIPGVLLFSNEAIWGDQTVAGQIDNTTSLTDNVSLKTALSHNNYRTTPGTQYVFPLGGGYYYDGDKYARGVATTLEQQLDWKFSDKVSVIAGYEFSMHESVPKATVPGGFDEAGSLTEQSAPVTYVQNGVSTTVQGMNQFVYNRTGVFVQGDWKIADWVRAVAGVRYNENTMADAKPVTPRLSLIFPYSQTTTVKLIYAQAFVYPAPYFMYNLFDNGESLNIPNPDLKPEQSQSTELNVLYESRPLYVNASIYFNQQKDLFLVEYFDPSSPGYLGNVTVNGDPRKLYQTTNAGESTSYGVDTLTRYEFSRALSSFLALSYVDSETTRIGVKYGLDRLSNVNVRVGATYKPTDRWTVSPRLSWRSDPEKALGGLANSEFEQMKNIYQVDLYTNYQAMDNLNIFARLNNLTNNKYLMRGFVSGISATPADTFNAHIGASYVF